MTTKHDIAVNSKLLICQHRHGYDRIGLGCGQYLSVLAIMQLYPLLWVLARPPCIRAGSMAILEQ